MHTLIDEQGYSDDIKVCCTIYDSIYLCVKCDATIIKWLNDTIIPILTKDIFIDTIKISKTNLYSKWNKYSYSFIYKDFIVTKLFK